MKKLAFLLVLVAAFTMALGVAAFAAETPHGPFDDNSAVCAACHRAHTSSAEYLLATPRVTGLCIACHDGSGADTDVLGGIYVVDGSELAKDGPPDPPAGNGYDHGTWGAATSPLMGGGFNFVLGTLPATSKHMTPGTGDAQTLYDVQFGKGSTGPGLAKFFLDCVDCHMPHRSANYRMLRMAPTGYSGNPLSVPDIAGITSNNTVIGLPALEEASYAGGATGRKYTEDSGMFNTLVTNSGVAPSTTQGNGEGISKWCGFGCHDFYYRSAVRANNGSGILTGASPAMQTRATTSITNGAPVGTINVANTLAITAMTTYVRIMGNRFLVTAKTGTTITTTTDLNLDGNVGTALPGFDWNEDLLAGTPVSIEGAGMEVYYNLDGVAGDDPTFMHAIDVDLSYLPRNGSETGAHDLAPHLAMNLNVTVPEYDYKNRLPVADIGALAGAYDSGDLMTCLTCHRAHGSEAVMSSDAAIPARTVGVTGNTTALPSGSDSMLLRLPNRAVCQQCHNMPTGF